MNDDDVRDTLIDCITSFVSHGSMAVAAADYILSDASGLSVYATDALAAAEQRADTLVAAIRDEIDVHQASDNANALGGYDCECGYALLHLDGIEGCMTKRRLLAALSSRPDMDGNRISIPGPVQPESEQR